MNAAKHVVNKDYYPADGATCDACGEQLMPHESVYVLAYCSTPWKDEGDEDNDWPCYRWHVGCDEGSLAADGAL